MRDRGSSRKYAQVVFEIAREDNQFDEWRDSLKRIVQILEDTELKSLLEAPQLSFDKKREILEEHLKGVIPLALNLASLLIIKNRIKFAPLIESEYARLLDEYRGIEHAKVITAVPLDDRSKEKVVQSLENLTNLKVSADFEVDQNIVGGVVIKIQDKLIDGSLKNKLTTLKKVLSGKD